MSAAKRDAQAALQTSSQMTDMPVDERSGGWHRIAWAFLKVIIILFSRKVSGGKAFQLVSSNGALNTGNGLRLQLYKAPASTKLRDERQPEVRLAPSVFIDARGVAATASFFFSYRYTTGGNMSRE